MEKNSITRRVKLIIIGGSAGSFDIIIHLLANLKQNLSFPLIIVLHRKTSFDSSLTDLFSMKSKLPVKEAEEKEELQSGTIYIAPADYHLLIEMDHTVSLDYSEKIHYSRPAIDATLLTAAEAYGKSAAGIILSGANSDGADGLQAIYSAGGIAAVQDPETAEVSYMPKQALTRTSVHYILGNNEIADFINMLSDNNIRQSE